jgi:CRISPR system Cascade subunit CasD
MPETVVFTLWAPLAAMGDVAVGERRAGFDRPGRSAVLGLVAAALGLNRADETAHAALDRDYLMAQRVLHRGDLLQDYHTVQAPAADRKSRWITRREALDRPRHELGTLLSLRDYRQSPFVDIALVARPGALSHFSPSSIVEALRRPAFTLYFGRKACPLGLPPAPVVMQAQTLATVFGAGLHRDPAAQEILLHLGVQGHRARIYADIELAEMLSPDYRVSRIEQRRDRPLSRERWQFDMRSEVVADPVNGAV